MFRNQHESAAAVDVESPSRAAGDFPTLGGGVRARSRSDRDGRVAAAARVVETSEGDA
jgi:hypothetical protein